MEVKVLQIDPKLDLGILLYPSFALPMFEVQGNKVVKLWGVCKGLTVYKKEVELIIEHNERECLDYAYEVLGFWSSSSKISQVVKKYSEFIKLLKSEYSWLGVATSSRDDIEIFTSIFLSQNTDFHTNVVKWVRTILKNYGSIEYILGMDKMRIVNEVSGSYQVLNLAQALKEYLRYRDTILRSDDEAAKKYLLKIEGVGPKVSHAYLMFVKKSTVYAPIDRNLISFLSKFEITSNIIANMPRKDMCIKHTCNTCPNNINCTYYRIRNAFGTFSAWVQTVAYVHNKFVCKRKLCNKCFLKWICNAKSSKEVRGVIT